MTPSDKPCRLVVCRGCCCGTRKKRPGVDHEGQLRRLSEVHDHKGRDIPVRVSECLDICFQANVVVVHPSSQGRARGGRPVWFGEMTEERLIEELDDWIFEGGPGVAPIPESLEIHVTSKDAKKPKKAKKAKKEKKAKKSAEAPAGPLPAKQRPAKKERKKKSKKA
ncbi:hypothetical protein [Allosalinactinospora lopnorensis]|uniref:hypothetical protein n=1 Tax=Allosalinactinospora lopnorensis TaxID=1352348 RepID=UPI000623CEE6|nr:hypothetical protein [Allosalinactinospora lopnorensis]